MFARVVEIQIHLAGIGVSEFSEFKPKFFGLENQN
jgi:hypothetical protein